MEDTPAIPPVAGPHPAVREFEVMRVGVFQCCRSQQRRFRALDIRGRGPGMSAMSLGGRDFRN